MAVALVHTARCVLLGCIDNLIRLGLNMLILRYVLRPPSPGLRQAWQDKDQLHTGAVLPQTDHGLGAEGIKAQGASGPVVANAALVQADNDTFQLINDSFPFLLRYLPVACKAAGLCPFFAGSISVLLLC